MKNAAAPHLVGRASLADTLPAEHVTLTARRLAITTSVSLVVHVVYLVLYRTAWSSLSNPVGMTAGIAGLLGSMAVTAYLFRSERSARAVTVVAVGYEIFLTVLVSLSETVAQRYTEISGQVPWSAVIIVIFPFLIPARPRVVLLASFGSAVASSVTMLLALTLAGRPWPSPAITASYLLPPFLCALLAWAPTSALHRMGAAVQQARRLGSYELTERLGQGGMGEVWRATHRLLRRPAAVKLIKPEMLGAKDPETRHVILRRFEEEAQATASLESPHSVELYDFGVSSDGVLFYVMELLHGIDLETMVERFGPMPEGRVVHLLIQACDSLEDAHRRGLVHRDVKPANLFVARKGETMDFLKVLDFGLVKRWRDAEEADLAHSLAKSLPDLSRLGSPAGAVGQTAAGQIVGTPAFLAPEAAVGQEAIDHRADLYALGCVAYWMLTGTRVFEETTALAMAVAHVTKEAEPPSSRVEAPIDAELERLVMSCLQKDRERRPASAHDLRERLSAIAARAPWPRERATAWWREHRPASQGRAADPPASQGRAADRPA